MNKICKQCVKVLPDTDEYFRPYTPRGKGIRKSTVGRNTVCRECERTNNVATRIWKQDNKSPKELQFLETIATYYKTLVGSGGAPIGAYAKYVLNGEEAQSDSSVTSMDSILASVTGALQARDALMDEYNQLLVLELTSEPDEYQEMLEAVRAKSLLPNGKVKPEYIEIFNLVATRFDDYEDTYEWKDPVN